LALVDVSVVDQRYQAVLMVGSGIAVTEVAARFGVSRQSVHAWLRAYRADGLAGLDARSSRPASSPWQAEAVVEAAVCQMRRDHPRWGPLRISFELGKDGCPGRVPSRMTVYRILLRHSLISPVRRKRRQDYLRWERPAPMQLWQLDIVGGVLLTSGAEGKVVTGVDDHSRFCVIASVVLRQTDRAVCLALAGALRRYGIPDEILTDNGKQFTGRFGFGGEVLFDRICRDNGITHRLTPPRTPTTTGKVERFHQSLRRELLDHCGPFENIHAAQAATDAWVVEYNTVRPHQALDMASPADRFFTSDADERVHAEELLPLKLPRTLARALDADDPDDGDGEEPAPPRPDVVIPGQRWIGDAIEFDRVVPPSGNLGVAGRQFWLGPTRAGVVVTFWADAEVIHLLIGGVRVKTLRSHLSVNDLAALYANGGRNAGPAPVPSPQPGEAVEVDRTINRGGSVSLGNHIVLAAEILGGRRVSIRLERNTLLFFDPDTRELLRIRPNPLTPEEVVRLQGARPAGPPPQPPTGPVRVQRRASATGTVIVAGRRVCLGRRQAHQTVSIDATDTELVVHLEDGSVQVIARTNDHPVRWIKAHRPRKVEPCYEDD
jgi:transposase InsO family protein